MFAYAKTMQISFAESDQRLCFRYTDSTIPLLPIFEISTLAIFCDCTARFVSDLVGNPEDRFSQLSHRLVHVMNNRAAT